MKFENSLTELENIVKKMETNISLDESLELFNKGIILSKQCMDILTESKGKLEILTDEMNKITKAFDINNDNN